MNGPLTIVACPKPFRSHVGVIQRNAITSWSKLQPRPRIVLVGNEDGTADLCRELGLQHVPELARNEHGTPYLADVIRIGETAAGNDLVCYINSDIVLLSEFINAVGLAARRTRPFLMIGQRTDVDVTEALDFSAGWQERLRTVASERGALHDVCGIDYFVFTPGLFNPIPPFVIGRAAFDNWLVLCARRRSAAVINATPAVLAIHQNHDYSHHPDGQAGVYRGAEAAANLALAGGVSHLFWIDDHTHVLTEQGVKRDLTPAQVRRHWDRLPVTASPRWQPVVKSLYRLWLLGGTLLRAIGLRRPLTGAKQT